MTASYYEPWLLDRFHAKAWMKETAVNLANIYRGCKHASNPKWRWSRSRGFSFFFDNSFNIVLTVFTWGRASAFRIPWVARVNIFHGNRLAGSCSSVQTSRMDLTISSLLLPQICWERAIRPHSKLRGSQNRIELCYHIRLLSEEWATHTPPHVQTFHP